MSQNVSVYVRVRPLSKKEIDLNSKSIVTCTPTSVSIKDKQFFFDKVFGPESTQQDIFSVIEPLVQDILNGYKCTIFAYGQTGSGKTYTMSGPDNSDAWNSESDAGLVKRVANCLFDKILCEYEYSVTASYLELYNEEIRDLLSDDYTKDYLPMYSDPQRKGSVCIVGLKELPILNRYDIEQLFKKGNKNRQVAYTNLNSNSSRSHTVFSITVHNKKPSETGEDLIKMGKINLVDLAGSESMNRAETHGRSVEVGNINKSLLTLGRVIQALSEKKNNYIPYRDSKLTRILQDSLGGTTKTSIISTISPAACNCEESLSTLYYANKARDITNCPEVNETVTKKKVIQILKEQIESYKRDILSIKREKGILIDVATYSALIDNIKEYRDQTVSKKECINYLNERIRQTKILIEEKSRQWDDLHTAFEEQNKKVEDIARERMQKLKILKQEMLISQTLLESKDQLSRIKTTLRDNTETLFNNQQLFLHKLKKYRGVYNTQEQVANTTRDYLDKVLAIQQKTSKSYLNSSKQNLEELHSVSKEIVDPLNNTAKNYTNSVYKYKHALKEKRGILGELLNIDSMVECTRDKTKTLSQVQRKTGKENSTLQSNCINIKRDLEENVNKVSNNRYSQVEAISQKCGMVSSSMKDVLKEERRKLEIYIRELGKFEDKISMHDEAVDNQNKLVKKDINLYNDKVLKLFGCVVDQISNEVAEIFNPILDYQNIQRNHLEDVVSQLTCHGQTFSENITHQSSSLCEEAARLNKRVQDDKDNEEYIVNVHAETQEKLRLFSSRISDLTNHYSSCMKELQTYEILCDSQKKTLMHQVQERLKNMEVLKSEGDTPEKRQIRV